VIDACQSEITGSSLFSYPVYDACLGLSGRARPHSRCTTIIGAVTGREATNSAKVHGFHPPWNIGLLQLRLPCKVAFHASWCSLGA